MPLKENISAPIKDLVYRVDFLIHFGVMPEDKTARSKVEDVLYWVNSATEGLVQQDFSEKEIERLNHYFQLAEKFGFIEEDSQKTS